MTVYAVQYTYDDRTDVRDRFRPEHRAYLGGLVESGELLSSGPWADGAPGALLVLSAPSTAEVERLLDADPFAREGVVAERSIREWTPVLGVWSS
ncbi:YciI family protein [Cellulomonas sp. ATA003]|uniref:YciI family protein n=1 Tax=Cellulomonas sp. ATA003 TaxID=3073064 RepID=UPI00287382AE|nr:YciI family protein [Cellulomonas sp. ATA003]WNB87023.1 YciI family protein [Cellulomonas sp. ATA003]